MEKSETTLKITWPKIHSIWKKVPTLPQVAKMAPGVWVFLPEAVIQSIAKDEFAKIFIPAIKKLIEGQKGRPFARIIEPPTGGLPLVETLPAYAEWLYQQGKGGPPKRGTKKTKTRKIDVAKALKTQHPEWTDSQIARQAGCDPSYLSKNRDYRRWAETVDAAAHRAESAQCQRSGYDVRTQQRHPIITDPTVDLD